MQVDAKNLQTIPQQIGIKNTKGLAYFLLFLFLALDFLKENATSKHILATFLIAALISGFTWFANAKRNSYYTSFWVESVPIVWLLLLLLL